MKSRIYNGLHNTHRESNSRGNIQLESDEEGISLVTWSANNLFDVAALHDGRKGISQLMHHHLGHLGTSGARNVAVTNAVFRDQDVVAQAGTVARGGRDAHVRL